MTETTRCEHCGILDVLGRHDGTCSYALEVGLPRLSEGEDPIDPDEEPELEDAAMADPHAPGPPDTIQRPSSQATHALIPDRPGIEPALWISYRQAVTVDESGHAHAGDFDAVIFHTEIDALRHAVREGYLVRPLELGRSIREQANGT